MQRTGSLRRIGSSGRKYLTNRHKLKRLVFLALLARCLFIIIVEEEEEYWILQQEMEDEEWNSNVSYRGRINALLQQRVPRIIEELSETAKAIQQELEMNLGGGAAKKQKKKRHKVRSKNDFEFNVT